MYTYILVYTGMYVVLSIYIYPYRYMHTHKGMCATREYMFQGNALCVYLCTYIYSGTYLYTHTQGNVFCAIKECMLRENAFC